MSRSGSACCVSRQDREVPKRRWGKDGSGSRRFRPGSARFRNHGAGREGRVGRVGRRLTRWEDLVLRLFLDDEPFKLNNPHDVSNQGPRNRDSKSKSSEKKGENVAISWRFFLVLVLAPGPGTAIRADLSEERKLKTLNSPPENKA